MEQGQGKMGVGKIALFSLCAVIVVDTLTASASIGVSAIGWWLLTFVVFVIPYGLITSELSTTYPGASPEEVELEVTDRIELAIQEMPQLDYLHSYSRAGVSVIGVNIKSEYWSDRLPQV